MTYVGAFKKLAFWDPVSGVGARWTLKDFSSPHFAIATQNLVTQGDKSCGCKNRSKNLTRVVHSWADSARNLTGLSLAPPRRP